MSGDIGYPNGPSTGVRVGTIIWEAGQHRLRLAGDCGPDDRAAVEEALAAAGDQDRFLILDLTAVETLSEPVADAVASACARADGCRVSVLRHLGTEVDRQLSERGV